MNKQHKNANCLHAKCSDQNSSHQQSYGKGKAALSSLYKELYDKIARLETEVDSSLQRLKSGFTLQIQY